MLNSAKQGSKEGRKPCLHFGIFLELKLLGLYFKGTFHLEENLKVKEKYTYKNLPNVIASFVPPQKKPPTAVPVNGKLIYMDLLRARKIITHEPLFALTLPFGLVTEESIICIALMVSLCWLTISTALTSTATPEAMGTEDIHPSQSLDDFHGFSWHQPHSVQN